MQATKYPIYYLIKFTEIWDQQLQKKTITKQQNNATKKPWKLYYKKQIKSATVSRLFQMAWNQSCNTCKMFWIILIN